MAVSVLIVEHDPSMARSVAFLMRRRGFAVRTVGDGDAAVAAALDDPPDLVLSAVTLPGRSGYSLCRSIRAEPALAHTRVVFLTACARAVDREKGLALGADDYVTKPFSSRDLIARVDRLLARGAR